MDPDVALEINGGEDEDEAIRRAIAMSLAADPDVNDVQSEDSGRRSQQPAGSEQAAAAAAAASVVDLTDSPPPAKTEPKPPPAPASQPNSSMLGLDRKKMEEDRLARLKKRKTPDSEDTADHPPSQKPRRIGGIVPPYLSKAISDFEAKQAKQAKQDEPAQSPATAPLPYPKGAVKKTWAFGHARTGDDIKIEEVLQRDQLELAVISSFQWDEEWLMSKLNLRQTKVILVAYANNEAQQEEMRSNTPSGAMIRFCFPPMQTMGAMHSKLQLLKFPSYLRIVVPSGNMVRYDWGETGVIENVVFLIDLPRIEDEKKRESNKLGPFGDDLCYFLRAQGLDEGMVRSLQNYDFSETARYGFVHTIAGSHTGDAWRSTGYCGLGRAVSSLGWDSGGPVEVDYVCSSLGSLTKDLMTAMYNACQGDSGISEYDARNSRPKKGKNSAPSEPVASPFQRHFRVYFPSDETVKQSRGGPNGAGTICFQSRWWNSPTFPKEILRDARDVRPGLLMHSKMLFVRQTTTRGWAYLGSANMSESAWGRLVKDKMTGQPKLTCRNWECGVVVPAGMPSDSSTESSTAPLEEGPKMLDLFTGSVPVPMQVPASGYIEQGASGRQPWFFHDG